MELLTQEYNTAVAVMRGQSPYLHDAYIEILDYMFEHHAKVILALGITPIFCSPNNPYTLEQRSHMFRERYPDLIIIPDEMVKSDAVWSKRLDKKIRSVITPNDSAVLYGGRDSFIPHYSGIFPTREFKQKGWISSTAIRKAVSQKSIHSADFRAGVAWGVTNRYAVCYPTVDAAIFSADGTEILLGRKEHEDKFRLIGGFADPKSPSYEADVRREVSEEVGIEIGDLTYIGSALIPDWRYENEPDCIKSLLFSATYTFGAVRANDDIEEARWHVFDEINVKRDIVDTHHELFAMLMARRAEK